ncbi:GSCFA domain-containing protein [Aeromonas enteropelogenes]|uniref:GSCFA domain-containing protein n=1 Tax=Aeromonas enteropelogenes TaxID=29489 RepID=UPI003988BB64
MIKAPEQYGEKWSANRDRAWKARNAKRWFNKSTNIFAIGSCFANNFSRWLVQHGVITTPPEWGMHYNPMTILNELRIAAGESSKELTWHVYDRDGIQVYVDCLRHTITASSLDELNVHRARIKTASEEYLAKAEGFLITLGLSEVWEQQTEGGAIIINRAPYKRYVDEVPVLVNRFLSVAETKVVILEIIQLIRRKKGKSVPIVFTLSPIPLKTTGAKYDPLIANVRSKAILGSAMHEVLDEDDSIAYFPAYEMFHGAPFIDDLWQDDLRHPTSDAISFACNRFIDIFSLDRHQFRGEISFDVPQASK